MQIYSNTQINNLETKYSILINDNVYAMGRGRKETIINTTVNHS
jgi:hypothetical protein